VAGVWEVLHFGDDRAADVDAEELPGLHFGQRLGTIALGQDPLLLVRPER
jgi:hypothetical protein